MRKFEIIVEDENVSLLNDLLKSLPYVKEVRHTKTVDPYTLASENALAEDWLAEEDDELQKLYGQ